MGIVDNTIEDGVGDGGFADHGVPGRHGKLGGYQRRFAAVSLLEDFEQVEPLLIVQRVRSPVVENE